MEKTFYKQKNMEKDLFGIHDKIDLKKQFLNMFQCLYPLHFRLLPLVSRMMLL